VVNTSAFHKVEECEQRPERAFQVNAAAPMNLARNCDRFAAVLVHFSTDYVFGGDEGGTPYCETDRPAPLNVYGASKLAGEHLIACNTDRYFILRTCGLYGVAGSSGKGGNFVETMLSKASAGIPIRVVDDQVLTPTYTADLAAWTRSIVLTGSFGLYHASSEGECSWYAFARHIFECAGIEAVLRPVRTSDFPSPVQRPGYSVLSKEKLRGVGVHIASWRDALPRYLSERQQKIVQASVRTSKAAS
jgi:dTDP-4-dehydrorhamnose reductase